METETVTEKLCYPKGDDGHCPTHNVILATPVCYRYSVVVHYKKTAEET